jgi:hypothetical protein
MKTMKLVELFPDQVDETTVHITGVEGKTEAGDNVLTYEERNAKGEAVSSGKALFFRNNLLSDIQVDETTGQLLEPYILSRDGKWITTKGAGINTEGFGRQPK